ncbi:arylsulfatase [Lentisphaera profundi]|uniref:Arylsulfatase n=1 Tax=Lentisphaera profundi TaxID=1658616 RepID=A0ABY7W0D3_9BACT|nr:arylsulfatase [Lentisphaera profundi]WDE98486.1 arylsulfatase [Lentisphaera profundi]
MKNKFSKFTLTSLLTLSSSVLFAESKPNVIVILADDMGKDSVSAFNPNLGFKTPRIDSLVGQGMSFSDAHSGSAVCTPTRYGLLTGRYSWRSRLKSYIVPIWDGALIEKGRMTIGSMLQKEGYHTSCIGKWHLGMDWTFKASAMIPLGNRKALKKLAVQGIDWTQPIKNGPNDRGFDYHFGDDTINWPPFAFIENDRIIGTPDPKTFKTNDENWAENKVLPTITAKAVDYITTQAKSDKPFFLYFPMTSPHSPIAPAEGFLGKSGISPYVDFVIETDHRIGQIIDAVDQAGIAENTIIILTADNGTSITFPSKDGSLKKGVNFNNSYRGAKSDIWEGGHNVPFIVRWPKEIKAGSSNQTPICLTDIMATIADINAIEVPVNAAEDSVSILPALQGKTLDRGAIINHSISGKFAIRKGKWKLAFCSGSGGWSLKDNEATKQGLPDVQLYNLEQDPKETTNLINQNPELVKELTKQLHSMISKGRTTPGADQSNVGETWLPEL